MLCDVTGSIRPNHSQGHTLSFSPKFCQFESYIISDEANRIVLPIRG